LKKLKTELKLLYITNRNS